MKVSWVRVTRLGASSVLSLSVLNGCTQSMKFAAVPVDLTTPLATSTGADGTASLPSPATAAASCSSSFSQTQVETKLLFIVDVSGSNANSSPVTCATNANGCTVPATDPTKAFREGSINAFFTKYRAKTNFSWSFATFSDSAKPYIANASGQPIFTSDTSLMANAISQFTSASDGGGTSYSSALSLAAQAIANDPDLNGPLHPNYLVILMTDGFPGDYLDAAGNVNVALLDNDIMKVTNLGTSRVTLNTVYYGSQIVDNAINLLQSMASQGSGQFANASGSDPTFSIDSTLAVPNCPTP